MSPTSMLEKVTEQVMDAKVGVQTKDEVVAAINEEAQRKRVTFGNDVPGKIYDLLAAAVGRKTANTSGQEILHHLTNEELATLHDVLEMVMIGGDLAPEPGTAHSLINEHFLPRGSQVLVHTVHEVDGLEYCAVAIVAVPVPA
jgi:hypothetical protein